MSMSAKGHVFDAGSDLSDIGDSDSPPPTPGSAETPRTTPTPKEVSRTRDTSLSPIPTTSSNRKVGGSIDVRNKKAKKRNIAGNGKEDGGGSSSSSTNLAYTKIGKKVSKKADSKDVVQDSSSPSNRKLSRHEVNRDVNEAGPSKMLAAGISTITKKPSVAKKMNMKGWAFVPDVEPAKEEPLIVSGKRSRKTTAPYNVTRQPSNDDQFKSVSEKQFIDNDESSIPSIMPAPKQGKRRLKIKIHTNRKRQPQMSPSELDDAEEEGEQKIGEFLSPLPMDEDENDEEDIQPNKKRKRKSQLPSDEDREDDDDDGDYDEKSIQATKPKKTRPEEGSKLKKKEKKKERGKKKKKKEHRLQTKSKRSEGATFPDEIASDEYKEEGLSDDEAMSEDEDSEASEPPAPKVTTSGKSENGPLVRLKRKSESFFGKSDKPAPAPAAPRNSSASTSATPKTVAGVINHFTKASGPEVKPTAPKVAIRKVPSVNFFDNIMGFGSKSKEATPNRSPANQPKPANAKTNTPNSPLVRPSLLSKKAGDRSASPSIATPTRAPSSSFKSSPLTTNGQARQSLSKTTKGAEGEHVTAAEMALLQKKEFFAYSNPTGLFDLMEGAEIMMQFEEETRQLLPHDELIAKTKLYRASRTEGLPKLVERIKQSKSNNSHPR